MFAAACHCKWHGGSASVIKLVCVAVCCSVCCSVLQCVVQCVAVCVASVIKVIHKCDMTRPHGEVPAYNLSSNSPAACCEWS